jgi:hypothetical protein
MKSLFSKVIMSLSLSLLAAQGVQASCSSIIKQELEVRMQENKKATRDLVNSTIFAIPFGALFLPGAIVFEATAITFKGIAMVKVSNAKQALAIYTEAANGGGNKTKRLLRKINRQHPSSELTYEQLLAEIRLVDEQELGCAPGSVPKKKDIISVIDARDV